MATKTNNWELYYNLMDAMNEALWDYLEDGQPIPEEIHLAINTRGDYGVEVLLVDSPECCPKGFSLETITGVTDTDELGEEVDDIAQNYVDLRMA